MSNYREVYDAWRANPEAFWMEAAQEIDWITPPTRALDDSTPPLYRWFVDAECNTCWNCVDRHVLDGRGEQAAIIYDSPITGHKRTINYTELLGATSRLAGALKARALSCLDRVGMASFADRQIGQLSGGQQQRVFLARALAQDADLYLLDEPFAGVDAATERAIIDVLKSLKSEGKAVVCVHHDLATVRDYFDNVFMINVRGIAEGPVATTFNGETLNATYGGRLAATHIDQLNLVEGA